MKPIKLIISGFGPYGDTMPAIEFDKFAEKGLFLISGDTGAGKTTIFDAISFALYGITSGSYKNTKNLRSEYAKPEIESYVDFYFSHQGNRYHICRKPSYERMNRNGKLTEEPEKVIFYYEDGSTVEGTRNVDGTKEDLGVIRNLLHVDAKQFKQIAMIAQGEFWDLLNAKTEDRTVILRTIFETEAYKNLEGKLREKMNISYRHRMETENSILQYFSDVTAAEDCEYEKELQDLQEIAHGSSSVWNLNDMIAVIENIMKFDRKLKDDWTEKLTMEEERLNRGNRLLATAQTNNDLLQKVSLLKEEKEKLDEKKETMEQLSLQLKKKKDATYGVKPSYQAWQSKLSDIENTQQDKETLQEELITVKEKETKAQAAFLEVSQGEKEKEAWKTGVSKMKEDEEQYAVRDSLLVEIKELEKEQLRLEKEEQTVSLAEKSLKEKISSLKSRIQQIKDAPAEYLEITKLNSQMSDLVNRMKKIQDEHIPNYKKKKELYEDKQQKYRNAHDSYIGARENAQHAKEVMDGCRAGILAQNLTEGSPCPVCGSTHHIKLADLPDRYISEEQYKQLEEILDQEHSRYEIAVADAEGAKKSYETELEHLEKEIIGCLKHELYDCDIPEHTDITGLIDLLQEGYHIVSKKLSDGKKKETSIKCLCDELETVRNSLEIAQGKEQEKLEQEKCVLSVTKQQNQSSLVEKKTALKSVENLPYENLKVAQREREKIEKRIFELEERIQSTREQRDIAVTLHAKTKASFDTINITLDKQLKDGDILYQKFMSDLSERGFSSREEFLSFIVSEDSIKEEETMITKYHEDKKTNKAQLKSALSDSADKKWIDVDNMKKEVAEQNQLVASYREQKNIIEYRLKTNEDKLTHIKDKQNDLENSRKEYTIYSRLYSLVTGQTGKGKITLEQYIQAAGFDHIIEAANRRLLPMTDYQFELYRQEDSLGKRSNTFLDLEVLDNFTGYRRPVGNLSGGESFKASLSLALGLSDTVSSHLGGVQMDALFVDEGFGTLDRKSIDSAMDILLNLAGTNKLVGIISHREELMENIPQQIKVTKTKNGSSMKMEGIF